MMKRWKHFIIINNKFKIQNRIKTEKKKTFDFASQNLLHLRRKTRFARLSPPADSRAFSARGLFLTDRVKPSLWQRLVQPIHIFFKESFLLFCFNSILDL